MHSASPAAILYFPAPHNSHVTSGLGGLGFPDPGGQVPTTGTASDVAKKMINVNKRCGFGISKSIPRNPRWGLLGGEGGGVW